jgi:hypothetical protein
MSLLKTSSVYPVSARRDRVEHHLVSGVPLLISGENSQPDKSPIISPSLPLRINSPLRRKSTILSFESIPQAQGPFSRKQRLARVDGRCGVRLLSQRNWFNGHRLQPDYEKRSHTLTIV